MMVATAQYEAGASMSVCPAWPLVSCSFREAGAFEAVSARSSGATKCDGTGQMGAESAIIWKMATVYMNEGDVARDLHAVLAKVKQGIEVVIEQDHRPVAVLRAQQRSGRPVTEILADAQRRNSGVTLDPDFGDDMNEVIASHQRPWSPPSWD